MSWLTGTVISILLCLTFRRSHATLHEPTPTSINDRGVISCIFLPPFHLTVFNFTLFQIFPPQIFPFDLGIDFLFIKKGNVSQWTNRLKSTSTCSARTVMAILPSLGGHYVHTDKKYIFLTNV